MAKEKVLPADAVKQNLTAGMTVSKPTLGVVEKSEEELAMLEANAVEIDEADLDAADAAEMASDAPKEVIDLSEDPVIEDPEIAAKRKEMFRRAAEFEAKREADRQRKADRLAGRFEQPAPPTVDLGAGEIPEVFYKYATAIPATTPDEHVLCGYGSIKLRVGDFRRLVGLPSRI